jgi:transcription antitermination factor NusG
MQSSSDKDTWLTLLSVAGQRILDQRSTGLWFDHMEHEQYKRGDRIRVRSGTFLGYEGVVKELYPHRHDVLIETTFRGRPLQVDLYDWQIELIESDDGR